MFFKTNLCMKFFLNKTQVEETSVGIGSAETHSLVTGCIELPRWPKECQVLESRIKHIHYVPSEPEPYYVPPIPKTHDDASKHDLSVENNNHEIESVLSEVGDKDIGKTVYHYKIERFCYFHGSDLCNTEPQPCIYTDKDSLHFESRFESGNLEKVEKFKDDSYKLYLRSDFYSNKQMQWFYFRVTNMKKDTSYRFSIVNMTKQNSLYTKGLKPLLYSVKDEALNSIGWRRCGDNIYYFSNKSSNQSDDQMFTLTFTIEFPHDDDTTYFAYCYPYTYTDLQDYLSEVCIHPIKSTYTKLKVLCKTLADNNVYYVAITAPHKNNRKKRKVVVMSARVHPGETPSSWIMKGVLDFLTGDSVIAITLRKKFLFLLVPMLNPDGVVVGNSRYSLSGRDLNRQYQILSQKSYPTVWNLKRLIEQIIKEHEITLYCDLHAHSQKHNIFIYGCKSQNCKNNFDVKAFPLMLHENASNMFSFDNCTFHVNKAKEGTARVVMWMLGIHNSFTMEASFGGTLLGDRAATHFTVEDYEQMGHYFCKTLLDYYERLTPKQKRLKLIIIALTILGLIVIIILLTILAIKVLIK